MIDEKKLIELIDERHKYWESKAAEYDERGAEISRDICDGKAVELEYVRDLIDGLAKRNGWILPSERLPESGTFTLVTIAQGGSYVDIKYYGHDWESIPIGAEVLAWIELPLPYGLQR